MATRTGVRLGGGVFAMMALLSAVVGPCPAEAAVSGWPLRTYELETEAEVRLTSCPNGWRFDGHQQCLLYVPASIGWNAAQNYCQDTLAGASLPSVSDALQMAQLLVRAKRAGRSQVWIGLNGQTEGDETVWGWADGSPLGFQAWDRDTGPEAGQGAATGAGGDGRQLCAAFTIAKKSWSSVPCDTKLSFFCGYLLDDEE